MFKFEDLPKIHFTSKSSTKENHFLAIVKPSQQAYSGYTDFFLSEDKLISGYMKLVNKDKGEVLFNFESPNEITERIIGNQYYLIDGYWGERASLVLDKSLKWEKVDFKSSDSVICEETSEHTFVKPLHKSESTPENAAIIKDGWDHEHCFICCETISDHGNGFRFGYYNDNSQTWICPQCYKQYITTRSLAFIEA